MNNSQCKQCGTEFSINQRSAWQSIWMRRFVWKRIFMPWLLFFNAAKRQTSLAPLCSKCLLKRRLIALPFYGLAFLFLLWLRMAI
jgi:hypothetical protein